MALIDRLIRAIYKYRAEDLVLATGEKVTLAIGGSRRPVSAEAVTRQQMELLLREVVPARLASAVAAEGSHEFPYTSPAGAVKLQVERAEGFLRIRAVPAGSDDSLAFPGDISSPAMTRAADSAPASIASAADGAFATRLFEAPRVTPPDPPSPGTTAEVSPAAPATGFKQEPPFLSRPASEAEDKPQARSETRPSPEADLPLPSGILKPPEGDLPSPSAPRNLPETDLPLPSGVQAHRETEFPSLSLRKPSEADLPLPSVIQDAPRSALPLPSGVVTLPETEISSPSRARPSPEADLPPASGIRRDPEAESTQELEAEEEPEAVSDAPDELSAEADEQVSAAPSRGTRTMEDLFIKMVQEGCSDLHLATGSPPLFRKDGEIVALGEGEPLTETEVRELVFSITPRVKREEFVTKHDTDFVHEVPAVARFRCNLFVDRMGMGGVFRQIPTKIPTAEDLGLSRPILQLCELSKGLVLVTGPTGSGKSTTLAALIDHINRNRTAHIITIEDPIEFVHANQKCLIRQREVGTHTEGFKEALRAALREDPDCILVGEMRDLETIALAIETAETGHLVFGTLHTNTAVSTVDRMIDQFPADRQSQVRTMLSESLKGVLSQTLCKKKGGGRVAALEVLLVTAAVSNLIREGKAFQIPSIMQTGKGLGMATLNDALLDLVQKGVIHPREAYFRSVAKAEMKVLLEKNSFKIDAA
jgi:twitching motility protein PilT